MRYRALTFMAAVLLTVLWNVQSWLECRISYYDAFISL